MISFELTEEQLLARTMSQQFGRDVLRPAARAADEGAVMPGPVMDQVWSAGFVQSVAAGDGDERSAVMGAVLLEELAAGDAGLALAAAAPLAFVNAVVDQGSDRQKQELLPLFAGDRFHAASVAVAEPSARFDPAHIGTKAAPTGSGFSLDGVKTVVPLAARCSHFLVVAQCNDALDAFIVPANLAGVTVGAANGGLGLRAAEMSEVRFEKVSLPASARLGENRGCDAQRVIDAARIGLSAVLTGVSRGVFEYVTPYLKERVAHGSALARKQSIAFKLADMHVEIEAMRWMTWKAARQLEKHGQATREARLAAIYAGEQAMWIADEGLQMLGGHGFVRDHPVELWYRNARTLSVLEGIVGV